MSKFHLFIPDFLGYLILFDLDVRKRHYHKTTSGKVTVFMVQLEIKVGDIWKEVVTMILMKIGSITGRDF
ncbi:MAG: hypothetical protein HY279_07380 [Nitrospinae bacterium]|nr:hypothetical protein [Nitrospinota bacterium]